MSTLTLDEALALLPDSPRLTIWDDEQWEARRENVIDALQEVAEERRVGSVGPQEMWPRRRIVQPSVSEWKARKGFGLALLHWPEAGKVTWIRTRID